MYVRVSVYSKIIIRVYFQKGNNEHLNKCYFNLRCESNNINYLIAKSCKRSLINKRCEKHLNIIEDNLTGRAGLPEAG